MKPHDKRTISLLPAASAAAPSCIFLSLDPSLRAGDVGPFLDTAEAGVSWWAYGAGSLTEASVAAVALWGVCESASAIGRGTKWSVATEAVWKAWGGGGLWRDNGWETLGSQTPTKTASLCGRQTASGAWAGTAQRSEREMALMRGTTVFANRH